MDAPRQEQEVPGRLGVDTSMCIYALWGPCNISHLLGTLRRMGLSDMPRDTVRQAHIGVDTNAHMAYDSGTS